MMEYFSAKRAKSKSPMRPTQQTETPLLTEEDEAFLARIQDEGTPPELPERPGPPLPQRPQDLPVAGEVEGNNAQIALMDGSQNIPLPDVPDTPDDDVETAEPEEIEQEKGKGKGKKKEGKKTKWSFLRRDSRDVKRKSKNATATDLMSAAENLKSPDAQPNEDHIVSDPEATKEEEEMASVLEDLNLAAVNNRVFSVSKESQELLRKFTLVLKDLVNGVPTAYSDLESLLTNSEDQIQRSYKHLPPWLQKLVQQLPSKMTKSVGPEVLAAAAEKHGMNSKYANMAAKGAEKAGLKVRVPSLKDLVTKPGAVAGMLKAIMNFLKLRFPAFLGMNVLYSLALFILLFIFWYCHKRGREVRMEKERLLNESEIEALADDAPVTSSEAPPTTTAPPGATTEEVEASMREAKLYDEAQRGRKSQYAEDGALANNEQGKERGKKAGVKVTEVDVEDEQEESSRQREIRAIQEWKRKRREDRWASQPSKAPLHSQESCLVC
ncbi:hypothetical protein ACLMJK_003114 [Lecanora helva]